MLLVQADEAIGELAFAVVASSGRTVAGLSGPLERVVAARKVLGLAEQTAVFDSAEVVTSLALEELQVRGRSTSLLQGTSTVMLSGTSAPSR